MKTIRKSLKKKQNVFKLYPEALVFHSPFKTFRKTLSVSVEDSHLKCKYIYVTVFDIKPLLTGAATSSAHTSAKEKNALSRNVKESDIKFLDPPLYLDPHQNVMDSSRSHVPSRPPILVRGK